MRRGRTIVTLGCVVLVIMGLALLRPQSTSRTSPAPSETSLQRHVLLIGLDGCSFDLVREWAAAGKMPAVARLLFTGASGNLATIATPRQPGKAPTISSPVVWTTIATGKLPDKHGVWDFGQPLPEQLYAWIERESADVRLPPLVDSAIRLRMELSVADGYVPGKIVVELNGKELSELHLEPGRHSVVLQVEKSRVNPETNLLEIDTVPAPPVGTRSVGCRSIVAETAAGDFLGQVDPWRNAEAYATGWALQDTTSRPLIQPAHRQVRAIWDILSDRDMAVATVGWWGTWPAYQVNGLMLSSHLGLRGKKTLVTGSYADVLSKTPHLTYPESYLQHMLEKELFPQNSEDVMKARVLDMEGCTIAGESANERTFADVFTQDVFYHNLAADILRSERAFNLVTVFFEGPDVVGHKFYDFLAGRRRKDAWIDCPRDDRLARVVQRYYMYLDEMIGSLLANASPRYDTVMIVTDHGFDQHGHADNGWIAITGPGIKPRSLRGASVRDVTPTLLYLCGLPVAGDMDGRVLVEAFTDQYLADHPTTTIRTYETSPLAFRAASSDMDKEMEERLRALGYIQ
ncbi:MAG: alkaline phosphatase family protein [Acidobacteriota bacterium]